MKLSRSGERASAEPDFTPLIDVVFLLLIFSLWTVDTAGLANAAVRLPAEPGDGKATVGVPPIVVDVLADGSVMVADSAVNETELVSLAATARRASPTGQPKIRADRAAPAGRLNSVIDALRRGGFDQLSLATTPTSASAPAPKP